MRPKIKISLSSLEAYHLKLVDKQCAVANELIAECWWKSGLHIESVQEDP